MGRRLKKNGLIWKQFLSILICFSMIFSSVSMTAFAEETQSFSSESSIEDVSEDAREEKKEEAGEEKEDVNEEKEEASEEKEEASEEKEEASEEKEDTSEEKEDASEEEASEEKEEEDAGEEKEEAEKEEVDKEETIAEKVEIKEDTVEEDTVEEDTAVENEADEVIEREEKVTLESVQAMLDHLPDEVTDENFDDVMLQIEAIDEALEMLDSEQSEKLDFSKYLAIGNLLAGFAIINTDLPASQELDLIIPIRKVVKGKNGEPVDGTFDFRIVKEYFFIPEIDLNKLDGEIDVNLPKVDIDVPWFNGDRLQITTTDYVGEENYEFKVTRPGHYIFIITEDNNQDLMFEDNNQEYCVEVVVEPNPETGELEVTSWRVNREEADEETVLEFVNYYNHDKDVVTVNIPIHKVVTGEKIVDGRFKFHFNTFSPKVDISVPKVEGEIVGPKVDIDLPTPPIDYSPEVSVMSASPKFSMPDIDLIEGPEHKLDIQYIDKEIIIETIDGEGSDIVELKYDHEGTYEYIVSEESALGDFSYKYDTKTYRVKVTVVKDDDGKLSASYEVTYTDYEKQILKDEPAEEIVFENEARPFYSIKKNVIGNDKNLDNREFEFESRCYIAKEYNWRNYNDWYDLDVYNPDIQWEEYFGETFWDKEQIYNPKFTIYGDGESYPELPWMDCGVYKFVIKEINTGIDGYVYDDSEKELYIKYVFPWFLDDEQQEEFQFYADGQKVDCGYEFEFTNRYKSTDIIIPVEKKISGDKPENAKDFTFVLSQEGQTIDEVTITGEGSTKFNALTFDKAGEYTYTVNEMIGNETGYTYDQTVHTVVVTVTELNGEFEAEWSLDGSAANVETKVLFTNQYEKPETPEPKNEEPKNETPNDETPKNEEPKNETPTGGNSSGGGSSSGGQSSKGSNTSGGPGVVMKSIENNETPLAETPEQAVETVEIMDEEVPLAMLPKTGDNTKDLFWIMLGLSSFAMLAGIYTFDKKKHN